MSGKHGEDDIGGMCFVDGLTKLGSAEALSILSPEMLSLVPGFFATETQESVRSLTSLLGMCFIQEPSPEDLYLMLGYNLAVPPYVRQALFSRSFDNDDLLQTIRKPVLVVHGVQDAVVNPANRQPLPSRHQPRADSADARRWARAVLGRRRRVQRVPAHILRKPLIVADSLGSETRSYGLARLRATRGPLSTRRTTRLACTHPGVSDSAFGGRTDRVLCQENPIRPVQRRNGE
jgi:hypothetical protein